MLGRVVFVVFEALLLLAATIPNVLLLLVTTRHPSREIDIGIIRIIALLDLLCVLSLLQECAIDLFIHVFAINYVPLWWYIVSDSLLSMPGALVGVCLAAILAVVRCLAIVFRVRSSKPVVYGLALLLAVYIFALSWASYFTDAQFYDTKLLLHRSDAPAPWGWYTCSDVAIFSVSILTIAVSYFLIAHHYYCLRHLCDLQGIYLRGTLVGIVVIVALYAAVVVPRVVLTVVQQLNPDTEYENIGYNCVVIYFALPIINALFSLLLHEETRRQAIAIVSPSQSHMFQTFPSCHSFEK